MARVSKNLQMLKRQIDSAQRSLATLATKLAETQAALAAASSAYAAEMAERDTVPVAGEKRGSKVAAATPVAAPAKKPSRQERNAAKAEKQVANTKPGRA